MLSESATPRTDALYPDHDFEAFARQLERELAKLQEDRNIAVERFKQAEQRLAGVEKNAERYRWLRKKADVDDYNSWGNWISHWLTTKELDKVIDAAIAQEKK